jgi:uncharacterized protein YndB with AHSA1/START domain
VNVSRSRTVQARPQAVWKLVSDPHRLPAWWPRVERMEGVTKDEWTTVMRSERGKAVRADFRLEASEAPRRRAWVQQLPGTPFERLLWESRTEVTLAAAGADGTEVTLALHQRPRGWARLGGFLLRRAARRQLDGALAGLAEVVEP